MENVKDNLVINNDDPVLQSIENFNKSVKYGKNKGSDFLILTPEKFLYGSKEYIINSQILGDHFRSIWLVPLY